MARHFAIALSLALVCAAFGLMMVHGQSGQTTPSTTEGAVDAAPQDTAALKPVGVFPLKEELFGGRFVAYFDEPIVWPDGEGAPISVTPDLAGSCEAGGDYVSFTWSGSGRLPKGGYTFRLSPALRSESGKVVGADGAAYRYFTRHLTVRGIHALGVHEGQHIIGIRFSDGVSPEALPGVVSIRDAQGRAVDVTPLNTVIQFHQRVLVPADSQYPLTVSVAAGLVAADGAGPLTTDFRSTVDAPLTPEEPQLVQPSRDLRIEKAAWTYFDSGDARLILNFNKSVAAQALREALHVHVDEASDAPVLEFEAGGSTSRHRVVPVFAGSAPKKIRVTIDEGLSGGGGYALPETWTRELTLEGPRFGIRYHYWSDEGVEGPQLHLDTSLSVSAEALKARIEAIPAAGELDVRSEGYRSYTVSGDWRSETEYTLTVAAGLCREDGIEVLPSPLKIRLNRTPKTAGARLDYAGKLYFPRRAMGAMPLRVRNMDEVTVEAHELLPGNIVFAVEAIQNDQAWDNFGQRYARKIGEHVVAVPGAGDVVTTVPMPIDGLLPEGARGVFGLRVAGAGYPSTKIVLWTDLGVLAHWQSDALVLFVHNLDTLAPVAGAKTTIWSSKNQILGELYTDAEGVARLSAFDAGIGEPKVAVVETGSDTTFLELAPRSEDVTGFTPSMPPYLARGYDGFIYCDRDLYRPGETVHARWIVRDPDMAGPEDMPVVFRVTNPRNQEVHRETLALSSFGTGGVAFETKPAFLTGTYQLALRLPGEKTDFAWSEVHLEEFVPNRLEVEVQCGAETLHSGESADIAVMAKNLSGPPASGRKCVGEVVLTKGTYEDPAWPGYHFGNDEPFTPVVVPLGESETDEQGSAKFSFRYIAPAEANAPLRARIRAEVSELGGRAVKSSLERDFIPGDLLLGMALDPDGESRTVDVSVVAVPVRGETAPPPLVKVLLERRTWRYHVRFVNGQHAYEWQNDYETLHAMDVPLEDGLGHVSVDMTGRYGNFRIRVESEATPMVTSQSFYAGWRRITLEDAARPSLVKLALDKDSYVIGDEVSLRIESPFDGVALLVLQGRGFEKTMRVPVKEGVGEAQFIADHDACPNMWAEVTAIHGADPEGPETHPYASFAMVNIPVRNPRHVLDVTLRGVPEETRPGTDLEVEVSVKGHDGKPVASEVTLAAVDEGIHGILGYDNPDPAAWFARTRRADYQRAHYYDKVAYDFEAAHIGGGMLEKRLGKDTPDVGENWIKPVALWSGVVRTDENGVAVARFSLPEFNGKLRLVAVAATGQASGAAHDSFFVRRPFMLRTSMPRFALPGDTFACRTVVFNTTDTERQVRVGWSSDGTIGTQAGERVLTVPAQGQADMAMDFRALNRLGQGAIHWRADVLNEAGTVLEALREDAPLPVREPAGFQTEHTLTILEPGETQTFKNMWFNEDDRVEAKIIVGGDPLLRLRESLAYVVGYPYGCVEQTTSRCMPMYLLRQSEAVVEDLIDETTTVDHYLSAGIERLFSMQTGDGGIGFWPGSARAYPYGSAYAGHFLTLVHADRSLPIPEDAFKDLQAYLRRLMNDPNDTSQAGLYLRAYALYVLALDGDLEALEAIPRFDDLLMPQAGRYLLAAALAMNTKDVVRVKQYLAEKPSQPYHDRLTRGVLNSPIRATAVELLAMVNMEAPMESCHPLARTLERFLTETKTGAHRPNTQETAFVSTAYVEYLDRIAYGAELARGTLTGPGGETPIEGRGMVVSKHDGPGASFGVRNTGESALFVNFTVSGVPLNPVTDAVNEGIKVARSYVGPAGAMEDHSRFVHGETYLVDVELEVGYDMDHVVIADLLPSGLEIENPRLDADALAGYKLEGAATPSHLEVRDDRLVAAFDRLKAGTHHLYYLVRAVTPGSFQHPAVSAECMYAPEVRGRSASGRITVAGVE